MYLDRPPMTTSATVGLANESYQKLRSPQTGPFKVMEVSPTTLSRMKMEIKIPISIDQATLLSATKIADREFEYSPNEAVDKRDDNAYNSGGNILQKHFLPLCDSTPSIKSGFMSVKAIKFNTPYAGASKQQLTVLSSSVSTSSKVSIPALASKWRKMMQCSNDVDKA